MQCEIREDATDPQLICGSTISNFSCPVPLTPKLVISGNLSKAWKQNGGSFGFLTKRRQISTK